MKSTLDQRHPNKDGGGGRRARALHLDPFKLPPLGKDRLKEHQSMSQGTKEQGAEPSSHLGHLNHLESENKSGSFLCCFKNFHKAVYSVQTPLRCPGYCDMGPDFQVGQIIQPPFRRAYCASHSTHVLL